MGKFLMYLYLAIASYCMINVYLSLQEHAYQHTMLMVFLAFINLVLFSVFRKDVQQQQIRSFHEAKQ